MGWWKLQPAGLVAALTPYNDPLNLVAHKLGPAFALGAPVVLQPHPQTPFSALKLVEHFWEAGAPETAVQIVFGGAELGAMLVADRRPRIVSFTGGRVAGAAIAARLGLKRLLAELGGAGVVAVAADADLEAAAADVHSGAFWAAGQNCVHAQRIIVDARVAPELRDRLTALAKCDANGTEARDDDGSRAAGGSLVRTQRHDEDRSGARGRRECADWRLGREQPSRANLARWTAGGAQTVAGGNLWAGRDVGGRRRTRDLLHRLSLASDAIHAAISTSSLDISLTAYGVANAAALVVCSSLRALVLGRGCCAI